MLMAGVKGLVNILRGAPLRRDDHDGEERTVAVERLHDFAAAGAERGDSRHEKGDVGTERGRDVDEDLLGQSGFPEVIEGDEGVRGVRRAAAEAAAGREDFVEMNRAGRLDAGC